jgi:hypothetical protein
MIDDTHESRLAREYLAAKHPESAARAVTEIRLPRLTDEHIVIGLVRRDPKGPVEETRPIACAEHWDQGAADGNGEVRAQSFLAALAKAAIPATIKWRDDSQLLRLRYA